MGAGALATSTRTTCPYCGVGCGVRAQVAVGSPRIVEITGDEAHPANRGRLCVKGAALGETVSERGRLLHPMLRNKDGFAAATWEAALDAVASAFTRSIREHGPDSVALYVSGQLLTEDYYVANKLAKGFFGTANIDTNSRLCMSAAVAAHKRAFGADAVPVSYEDVERADLVVLVGSNTAWCHPVLYQRLLAAKAARPSMRVVVIDPRRTATCEQADLHLAIRPGTDVWLFNGLLAFLRADGRINPGFVTASTQGAEAAARAAQLTTGSPAHVARTCGVSEEQVLTFYRLFAATERTITAFSQGVNQSSAGVDKASSIINCHLFTGRIGKPGMGPFSITGQPNAMGGREVGGLANLLAAHLDIAEPAHRGLVQTFWNSPVIADKPGLKAVDLFDAVHAGRVKALWIMATNPVVSMPNANKVRDALDRCEFVAVSEVMAETDTSRHAHVLLPAAAWGEKDGTVTNSERRISRQRAFLPPAGEAKPDWWILAQVARRMGWADAFAWESPHEVFLEHARLSAHRNEKGDQPRDFNLAGLADLSPEAYDALEPVQWPVAPGGAGTGRLFGDGRFFHADGKARVVTVIPRGPSNRPNDEYPLVLNTGRVRDQWHTMSRTGLSPRLAQHSPEPCVDVHPRDALAFGLRDGSLARLVTRWGTCVLRVRVLADVPRGQAFVPIHWNGQTASDAGIGALVNPVVDPVSGQPELKHSPVRVEPFEVDWHGFAIVREGVMPSFGGFAWWVRVQGEGLARIEFAGRRRPEWAAFSAELLGLAEDRIEAIDAASGMYRAAAFRDGRLSACAFISPRREALPARGWLEGRFAAEAIDDRERVSVLAGRPPEGGSVDPGPTVCSCFGVGRNIILMAVREKGCDTPEKLGAALKCGTNCGSCVPELKGLVQTAMAEAS